MVHKFICRSWGVSTHANVHTCIGYVMIYVVFSLKSLINKEVNVVLHVNDELDPSSSLIIHDYESVKLFHWK